MTSLSAKRPLRTVISLRLTDEGKVSSSLPVDGSTFVRFERSRWGWRRVTCFVQHGRAIVLWGALVSAAEVPAEVRRFVGEVRS
jgi:hypothetical protein